MKINFAWRIMLHTNEHWTTFRKNTGSYTLRLFTPLYAVSNISQNFSSSQESNQNIKLKEMNTYYDLFFKTKTDCHYKLADKFKPH